MISYPISSSLRKNFLEYLPVAAPGHLHYFLSLLFLTFSISPFISSHKNCSIKKLFLKFCNIPRETPTLSLFLIKFRAEDL